MGAVVFTCRRRALPFRCPPMRPTQPGDSVARGGGLSNGLRVAQGLVEIGPEVLHVFDAYAQAEEGWRQVLLAGEAGTAFDGGLDCAEAGGVLDEMEPGADGVGGAGFLTNFFTNFFTTFVTNFPTNIE